MIKMEAINTEIKELFDFLYVNERQLTAGQMDFIQGCKKQFARTKQLSEKQISVLKDIKQFLPAQEVRFSGVEISQASGMKTEGLNY